MVIIMVFIAQLFSAIAKLVFILPLCYPKHLELIAIELLSPLSVIDLLFVH